MNLIEKMLINAIPYGEPIEQQSVYSTQHSSINSSIDPNVLKKDIKDMDEDELTQMISFVDSCFKELDEPIQEPINNKENHHQKVLRRKTYIQ